jgi:hypothetical protein
MTETKDVRAMLDALLQNTDDLDQVQWAVKRERDIRNAMARSGEGRGPVTEMVDAIDSMDQEAVLDLTEGDPTTLRDALQRYVAELEKRDPDGDELTPIARVTTDLGAILAYPWSGEEERVQLHNPHYGLALHVGDIEDGRETFVIQIGSERREIYRGRGDREGQVIADEVAHVVHRATLARVIADREHIIQLNGVQTRDLTKWLTGGPSGAMGDGQRLTVEAVQGGGVLIRTRPYSFQGDRELGGRS